MRSFPGWILVAVTTAACSSNSSAPPAGIPQCPELTLPATLHLTVSGYTTCTCLDGSFTLTEASSGEWVSPAIEGCQGQKTTAFFKLTAAESAIPVTDGLNGGASPDAGSDTNVALGVTDAASAPGSGNSDFAVATSITCAPLSIRGGGSRAGNITTVCPSAEDEQMVWAIAP
jgi:hypothetical protein